MRIPLNNHVSTLTDTLTTNSDFQSNYNSALQDSEWKNQSQFNCLDLPFSDVMNQPSLQTIANEYQCLASTRKRRRSIASSYSSQPSESKRFRPQCVEQVTESVNTTFTPSLATFSDDLLCQIGTYLNVESLNNLRTTCRKFNKVLKADHAGWVDSCKRLWSRKVFVLPLARGIVDRVTAPAGSTSTATPTHKKFSSLFPAFNAYDAYILSCIDAKSRQELCREEEFVYDPETKKGTIWSFRFKDEAGEKWTNQDPWHNGDAAKNLVFLSDGTVRELQVTQDPTGEVQHQLTLPFSDENYQEGVETQWRFVAQPLDYPGRMAGAYVRLTVNGRDVPTFLVKRSPTGNWGFVMENCWSVFASFPLTPKGKATQHSQESCSEDRLSEQSFTDSNFLSDQVLSVSMNQQSREALLYNLGASILPEAILNYSFLHPASCA